MPLTHPPTPAQPDLGWTPREYAKWIGRSPNWVRAEISAGNIPVVTMGDRTRFIPTWHIDNVIAQFSSPTHEGAVA